MLVTRTSAIGVIAALMPQVPRATTASASASSCIAEASSWASCTLLGGGSATSAEASVRSADVGLLPLKGATKSELAPVEAGALLPTSFVSRWVSQPVTVVSLLRSPVARTAKRVSCLAGSRSETVSSTLPTVASAGRATSDASSTHHTAPERRTSWSR